MIENNKISYADVLNNQLKKPDSNAVVIVQPKTNQSSNATKTDLEKYVDPQSFSINAIKSTRNGGVVINCSSNEDVNKLKLAATNNLGDNYTVQVPQLRKPKIKIFDIPEEMTETQLVEIIKSQNEKLKSGEFKVIKIYENKNKKIFGAIVEVDSQSFKSILNEGKIRLGWNKLRVE